MRVLKARPKVWAPVAAVLIWLLLTGLVAVEGASGTKLVLELPPEGAAGQEMTVIAHLADEAGGAIVGASVLFRREVEFMNAGAELELGRAVTDGQGLATLTFVPRSEGEMRIIAEFEGNAEHGSSIAYGKVSIATGPQLYVEEAGVKIPGVNVGLLAGILGIVWGGYFVVMTRIYLIAKGDALASSSESGASRE